MPNPASSPPPPSPSISEKSSVRSSSADSAQTRKPRAAKTSKVKNPKESKVKAAKATGSAPSKVTQKPEANNPSSELASEIRLLRSDVLLLREDVAKLTSTFQLLETRLNTLSDRITAQEERITLVEGKTAEVETLKLVVSKLQEQLNVQSQSKLRSELEITGVPENPAENPHHIILLAAAKVGIKVTDADIDYTARAGPINRTSSNQGTIPPRPLVVRFSRRAKRDEFYKAAKARRLTTVDLEFTGPAEKIFFNERLTRENRLLFRNCRNRAKNAGYKFVWTNGGTIFIKKREGRGSKPIIIRSTDDLDRALGNPDDQE
ncbi:hypothetical protein NE865_07877 [Phthorimaea operculella]|nr:hypothetical protein NE865_07877 [Phthorimaea operculella]